MPYPAGILSAAVFIGVFAPYTLADPILPDHAVQQPFRARVTIATGRVTRQRDNQPWAITEGDSIPVQQTLTTGPDGYAHFQLEDGSSFDLFANSRVLFRQNPGNSGDLLDVLSGRVRIQLHPTWIQPLQRIYTHSAIITADQPAAISLAIDEDSNLRIDVITGQVKVQHALLPSSSPVLVRAADALLVQPDQAISYRVDRGSLYRYTVKPIVDLWSALNPGRTRENEDTTAKFLAESYCPVESHLLAR